MNLIGNYEKLVSRRPRVFITLLIVLTLILSFFASQADMAPGEDDFQPDTEIASANSMINQEYGREGEQIVVIFVARDNVLRRDSLITQLELEQRIGMSDTVTSVIEADPQNPSGVSSPARLIATAAFINEATKEMPEAGGMEPSNESADMQELLMRKAFTLSIDEMVTILEGGQLTVGGGPYPIVIDFEPFEPLMLTELYENPFISESFHLEDILSFLFSKNYNTANQTASKSLMSIDTQGDISDDEQLKAEKEVQSLTREMSDDALSLRILGNALVSEKINTASGRNIAILMPVAFIFVIIILAVMYRNFTDTLLNLLSLVMAVVWVYGIGSLLGLNLGNPMMTTVPVLIIGLGIDYGIHFTSRYREELKDGKEINQAVIMTGATVGFAILLTTITTVLGFMSNIASNISAIRDFGILCSIGILSAFVLMLTFFPASKTLIDSRRKRDGKELFKERKTKEKTSFGKKFWSKIGEPDTFCKADRPCVNNGLGMGAIAARTPVRVIIVVLLITTVGVYGAARLEAEYNFTDFLPSDLEVTETFNIFVNDFSFSQETAYILVEGDVARPEVFQSMPLVQSEAIDSEFSVSARSPESPYQLALSMIDEGSNNYDPEFAEFWYGNIDKNEDGAIDEDITREDVRTVYSMLMELEDSSRILKHENGEFIGVVLRIPVDTRNEEKVNEVRDDMEKASMHFQDQGMERVMVTGGPIVSQSIFESIQEGQVQTLIITFFISMIILMGLYMYLGKGPLLGAVTILPLVFVISWTFGAMYFLSIPLNPVTVTIAAITVGLGIDYSIHLTQRFLEDTKEIQYPECALCVSTSHTGSALFGSATTTVIGFAILSLAIIPPLAQFGQVSAISITFAFLASVFVLPTFLLMWYRYKYQ
ncbi:MAG: MMPL family transporter [Thermoplasmata archaeon]